MIKENKYCSDVMKKHFNKELMMTKRDDEDFENSIKCWICDNIYLDGDVKVGNHCHITGKYRGSAHRNCNIKVKLSDKTSIVFHNLNNYDLLLSIKELVKFDFKITAIPNRSEKYASFNISDTLIFIKFFIRWFSSKIR